MKTRSALNALKDGFSLLAALALTLGLLESGCAPSGKPSAGVAADHLAQAEKLARAGRPRGAAELLEKFSSSRAAGNPGGMFAKIAEYYLVSGANRGALRWAGEALAVDPRDPAALYVKGEACRRLAEPAKAGELLREVLRISPAHPQACLSLARLKFRVSTPTEALPFF
ncbi:MAG: hypothetical protein VX675_02540 [Planctomycetota bacterium]|nr:hypothetical protein [Planctomycetota bacterium]